MMKKPVAVLLACFCALILSGCRSFRILPGGEEPIIDTRYPQGDETPLLAFTVLTVTPGFGDGRPKKSAKKAPVVVPGARPGELPKVEPRTEAEAALEEEVEAAISRR